MATATRAPPQRGPPPPAADLFSIGAHFVPGCAVLLTGASGYIGSLVLEKLLRSTAVGHVYLLMRPRRGVAPVERLARLLQGPLFHMIEPAEVAGRVSVVAGDIMEPGLGLSREDEAALCARIDTVIHSAADIRLDAPIHETLIANYRGSCAMEDLAARMQRLRSFVYVSTCYVNINKPPGFHVEERIYPVTIGGVEVDVSGVAEELLALPVDEAEARAAKYIELWDFKNTYALGKHLAEKAVVVQAAKHDLPLAIVRPSLVSAVAAEPYPGYSGNFAGQVGGAAAYLVGLYNDQPQAAATNGDSIWDVVPGDIVAHAIVSTAAAAAKEAVRRHITEPLAAPGAPAPPMIVQVGSSCSYPLRFADMFNCGVILCSHERRPFTLAWSRAHGMALSQRCDLRSVDAYMRSATNKVGWLVWILRMIGGKRFLRMARVIDAGLKTFYTVNAAKYDLRLIFNSGCLERMEECMCPEDREEFTVMWRPPIAAMGVKPAEAGGKSAFFAAPPASRNIPAGAPGSGGRTVVVRAGGGSDDDDGSTSGSGSDGSSDTSSASPGAPKPAARTPAGAAAKGAGAGAGAAPAARAAAAACDSELLRYGYGLPPSMLMQPGDDAATRRAKVAALRTASRAGGWQLFMFTMVAFLWNTIYRRPLRHDVRLPVAKIRSLVPHFNEAEAEAAAEVRHLYSHIA